MTLGERGHYDICEVCQWEDDGQDKDDADRVWGGSNADLSLSEARTNFVIHGINNPTEGPPKIVNSAAQFARGKHFVLVRDGSIVEEPAVGWRSQPV